MEAIMLKHVLLPALGLALVTVSSVALALSGINGRALNIGGFNLSGINGTKYSDLNTAGALQAKRLVLPDGSELTFR